MEATEAPAYFTFDDEQRASLMALVPEISGDSAASFISEVEDAIQQLLLHEAPRAPTPKQIIAMATRFRTFFLSLNRQDKDAADFVASRLSMPPIATALERCWHLLKAAEKADRKEPLSGDEKTLLGRTTGMSASPGRGNLPTPPSSDFIWAIACILDDHGAHRSPEGVAEVVASCCSSASIDLQSVEALPLKVRRTLRDHE